MKQRIMCMLLCIAIIFTSVDISALAAEVKDAVNTVSGNDLRKEDVIYENQNISLSVNSTISDNHISDTVDEILQSDANILTTSLETSGQCGDDLTWKIKNETLTISGTGAMWDYEDTNAGKTMAPWSAFEEQLTTLVLEEGITYIGTRAFEGCSCFEGQLVIPNTVTVIGDSAFQSCLGIEELVLSNNLKSIGNHAFVGCFRLKGKLEIPQGVEEIGYHAFANCTGFNGDLIIPSSVKVIGSHAFYYCSGIGTVAKIESKDILLSDRVFYGTAINTIYGFKGTDAEEYATAHSLQFCELDTGEVLVGSGAENEPYIISSADELSYFMRKVNAGEKFAGKYFVLDRDIYLNDISNYSQWSDEYAPTLVWDGINGFAGIFDGQDYTIYGLYMKQDKENVGFFNELNNQTEVVIKNVNFKNAFVSGVSNVGAIVGKADYIRIENCSVDGTVRGTGDNVGGFIGYSGSTGHYGTKIYDSINNSNVYGNSYVGGLVGQAYIGNNIGLGYENVGGSEKLVLEECTNSGKITGIGNYVGGIAGSLDRMMNCGGMEIMKLTNTGEITGQDGVGGIAGLIKTYSAKSEQETYLNFISNQGNVIGGTYVGGIAGKALWNGGGAKIINNSYNTGDVTANNSDAGGIYGNANGGNDINLSFNVGKITAPVSAGALIGYSSGACMNNVYYLSGTATNSKNGNGQEIVKELSADEMKVETSFEGFDFDNIWAFSNENNKEYPKYQWELGKVDEEELEDRITNIELSFGGMKRFDFSPSIFAKSSIEYDENISELAICLSTMVYETDGADESKEHKRMARNFQKLGFNTEIDIDTFVKNHYFEDETGNSTDETIQGNYAPFWIADREIVLDDNTYKLVFVVVRGTYDMEWIDNFDPGLGDTHMGFERAAVRVSKCLDEYIKNNNINGNMKVLVTGHSRGAAVANLVGKKLNDKEIRRLKNIDKRDIYVYTYATPNVTRKENVNKLAYNNIYNIVNPEDFVTKVIPSAWGYYRYGNTYVLPSSTFYSGITIEEQGNRYYVSYDSFVDAISDRLGIHYRPEANDYKEYNPYEWGIATIVAYVNYITSKVPDIESYYLMPLYVELSEIYSKAGIFKEPTLFSLFKKTLGYNRTKYYESKGIHNLINASLVWLDVGLVTATFFVVNGGITKEFGYAHMAETYMAMLDLIPERVLKEDKIYNGYIVNCPVDVVVKDKEGNILGKIEQNKVSKTTEELAMSVEGESKSFLIHDGADYTIELIGNDSGTMDYSIVKYDADIGEIGRTVYLNLPLEVGISYTQILNENIDAGEIPLLNEDSNVVEKTITLNKEQIGTLSVKVNIIGNGFAQGYESLTVGDYVIMHASTNEYNKFLGWYDKDGRLLSTDEEYGVSIEKSEVFTAKFTDNNEKDTNSKPEIGDIEQSSTSSEENKYILNQQITKPKDLVDTETLLSNKQSKYNNYTNFKKYGDKDLISELSSEGGKVEDIITFPKLENNQTNINENEVETSEQKQSNKELVYVILLITACVMSLGIVVYKIKKKKR